MQIITNFINSIKYVAFHMVDVFLKSWMCENVGWSERRVTHCKVFFSQEHKQKIQYQWQLSHLNQGPKRRIDPYWSRGGDITRHIRITFSPSHVLSKDTMTCHHFNSSWFSTLNHLNLFPLVFPAVLFPPLVSEGSLHTHQPAPPHLLVSVCFIKPKKFNLWFRFFHRRFCYHNSRWATCTSVHLQGEPNTRGCLSHCDSLQSICDCH